MITRQPTTKTLQGISIQRSLNPRNIHSSQNQHHHVFDKMPKPNSFAIPIHHSMLSCIHRNSSLEALSIFTRHLRRGLDGIVDDGTVAIALKACRGNPNLGLQIHGFAVTSGFVSNLGVSNSLMSMYCKADGLEQAFCVFNKLENPDIVSWNTMLSGFINGEDALEFARRMNFSGIVFDEVTCCIILAHSADHEEFLFGCQLHSLIRKRGLDCELYVGNALVTLYTKWGRIKEAERLFHEIPFKDLVSWNAMLSGYAQEGSYGEEAIGAFTKMVRDGMRLDHVSFTSAVSACGFGKRLNLGKQIHCLITKSGYRSHISVCNVLISMYSKCEVIEDALLVFQQMNNRNVISWTTMLSINEEEAMSLFNNMRNDGVYPNDVTFVGLIHAITNQYMMEEGRMVHGFCLKTSFCSKLNVANSFITMYARFESMEESQKIFDHLQDRDILSWNALISGYAQNGQSQNALHTFMSALLEAKPNEFTFGSLFHAIGSAEDISMKHGQKYHSLLIKVGLHTNSIVSGSLLDMYSRRGSISESIRVFEDIREKSQISWTAIISAHARHGDYDSVMDLFKEMELKEIKPDSITFLSVLTACGRKGMVDTGQKLFDSMVNDHFIQPLHAHYACMVDMLGRSGRLKEAEDLVNRIPGGPGLSVLQSLLGSCRIYGDADIGKKMADALMEMEPEGSGSYVLMSNLYAEKGEWEKVAKIRRGMRERGVKKEVGFSWVDVGDVGGSLYLHGFSSEDKTHPLSVEIYGMAQCIGSEMKLFGKKKQNSGELNL